MRRRVTFSRNFTLSLSRTCRCYCKYCAFATHQPHLHAPDEVLRILDQAAKRHRVKELLVLTGEKPEVNAEVAARLREHGHEDFIVLRRVDLRAGARARPAAAHEPRRARPRRARAAAGGDRLAGPDARVGLRTADGDVHAGLADASTRRGGSETIAAAGELRIPFTSGILVGIGETEEERVASLEATRRAARRARPHPGGDPPELRPAPELLRPRAGGDRRRRGARVLAHRGRRTARQLDAPAWATPVTIEDMKRLVAEARRLMPDVGIQVPPNLSDWWPELVARRRDRPRRAERERRPHLARAPVPVAGSRSASGCAPTGSR